MKYCLPFSSFVILHEQIETQETEDVDVSPYKFKEIEDDRFHVFSTCLDKPFSFDSSYLHLYNDFFKNVTIKVLTVSGKFLCSEESKFNDVSLWVQQLASFANTVKITNLSVIDTQSAEFEKTIELSGVDGPALEELVSDRLQMFPLLRKISVTITDTFSNFDDLRALKKIFPRVEVIFNVWADFFDKPETLDLISTRGMVFKIQEVRGGYKPESVNHFKHIPIRNVYINDISDLKCVPIFNTAILETDINDLHDCTIENENVMKLILDTHDIVNCDFSKCISLEDVTLETIKSETSA
ncbi:unnamed protein product [Ambrosiozyma monospora]|uniref:Unnamed protein product n=1 Tax=Ambrosiozyma monospora TaxID=43982 RepID=A0ACB5U715_AMBMO|nr:unnamed protein product [Ambrosiozyma monospora]